MALGLSSTPFQPISRQVTDLLHELPNIFQFLSFDHSRCDLILQQRGIAIPDVYFSKQIWF